MVVSNDGQGGGFGGHSRMERRWSLMAGRVGALGGTVGWRDGDL